MPCRGLFIDKVLLQTVSNHPVHILNEAGTMSPSSFIPFCYFGEEFVGVSIQEFEIPVCNIFKPRNYLDQLCYETNLQDLKDSQKIRKQLEMGLTLVLDQNEERQNYNINKKNETQMVALYPENDDVSIYLDTISLLNFEKVLLLTLYFRSCWPFWSRPIQSSKFERNICHRFIHGA